MGDWILKDEELGGCDVVVWVYMFLCFIEVVSLY